MYIHIYIHIIYIYIYIYTDTYMRFAVRAEQGRCSREGADLCLTGGGAVVD